MKRFITICLVLLFCASAYGTPVGQQNIATAVANVQTDTDAIEILLSDILAVTSLSGGNVWYVDNAATGTGSAADWTNADITIELALVHATANAGDYIVCAPYHVETASTGTFDLAKDGVTVVGLGKGDAMTTITYDTTTDTCIMGATGDGCTIRNIKFYTATDNVAFAIVVEDGCTDFVIEDCVFEATSSDEFLDAIYIHGTAANEGVIRRNRFLGDIASNTAPQSSIGFEDAHWLEIYDNEFTGDMGVAHIENKTTASNFVTIRDNRFICGYIGDAASTLDTVPGITLVATTTGWVMDNTIVTNVASEQDAIVAADCYVFGNRYRELQGNTLEVGKLYTLVKVADVASQPDALFLVAGGPIEVVSMFGNVTTIAASAPGNVSINLNSTDNDYDSDLSIVVALADGSLGDTIVFGALTASENAGVLTANQSAGIPLSWFVTEGSVEMTVADPGTGNVTWYMTFRPLVEGVTVTVQ